MSFAHSLTSFVKDNYSESFEGFVKTMDLPADYVRGESAEIFTAIDESQER